MKLKNILPYLFFDRRIKIIQYDCYTNKIEPEEIYFGSVLNVPWYIAEMYLYNTPNGESIYVDILKNNKERDEAFFEVSVVQEEIKNEKETSI